ncbi:hypothetical protein HBO23_32010 [Pseudomonas sp. WS 5532]|uniref:hypothetical protein n=1 Tax=Pseudomonas sp. WS 5532 TaxID=2717495 RepID=UPI0014753A55|nr:hypothetical protein [Pseudomonas sp. WS 5532]NMX77595.1 hypothetical protein [Pseudomonas sp. WS 5532]
MAPWEIFRQQVGVPAEFGAEQPYARFAFVGPGAESGADADVEFIEGDDETDDCVRVHLSHWSGTGTGFFREPVLEAVVFSLPTGFVVNATEETAELMERLLIAAKGLAYVPERDAL